MSSEMDEKRDAIGRRKRMSRVSTGKRVTLTPRDLLWFRSLYEHGPLPSSFLLRFVRDSHKSEKRTRERLTDLFNEEHTPHGGAYLSRPPQQFRTLDSRYNQLVYDLTPASERALREVGHRHLRRPVHSGPWLHGFMVSCITASIELTANGRDDLTYLPQSFLLGRADAELRYSVQIRDGTEVYRKDLIPDALFGLRYHTPEGDRYRCFLVEADRATEPATSTNFNRKSWQRSLLHYEAYLGGRHFRDHLRLKSSLLVLTVVNDRNRLAQVLLLVTRYAPSARSQMLFRSWEAFGPVFTPPEPHTALLEGAWSRAQMPDFRIDRV